MAWKQIHTKQSLFSNPGGGGGGGGGGGEELLEPRTQNKTQNILEMS